MKRIPVVALVVALVIALVVVVEIDVVNIRAHGFSIHDN